MSKKPAKQTDSLDPNTIKDNGAIEAIYNTIKLKGQVKLKEIKEPKISEAIQNILFYVSIDHIDLNSNLNSMSAITTIAKAYEPEATNKLIGTMIHKMPNLIDDPSLETNVMPNLNLNLPATDFDTTHIDKLNDTQQLLDSLSNKSLNTPDIHKKIASSTVKNKDKVIDNLLSKAKDTQGNPLNEKAKLLAKIQIINPDLKLSTDNLKTIMKNKDKRVKKLFTKSVYDIKKTDDGYIATKKGGTKQYKVTKEFAATKIKTSAQKQDTNSSNRLEEANEKSKSKLSTETEPPNPSGVGS